MKSAFVVLFSLFSFHAFPQLITLSDFAEGGKPLMTNKGVVIGGSPHFTSGMVRGKVVLVGGQYFDNLEFKYNVFDDYVEYNNGGKLFYLEPVKVSEFSFIETVDNKPNIYYFKRGFQNIGQYNELNYFRVLYGETSYWLIKYRKDIVDDPGATYGSVRSKVFQNGESLYYYDGQKGILFRRNKKSISSLFEQNANVEEVIKKFKGNLKNDIDLIKLITEIEGQLKSN
jgi:hypothetical protein